MAVDLICPDCGGVIGGQGVDSEGRGPCTCFQTDTNSDAPRSEKGDSSDTVSIPVPTPATSTGAAPAAVVSSEPAKLCIVCGKNVSGHRRVKDSRGYLCYDCAKKEIHAEKDGTVRCAECSRRIRPDGLVDYNGMKICKKCFSDHKEVERFKKKVATHQYDAVEKRSVKIYAIIFGILALILIGQMVIRRFL